jgi:hypothetical protein
MLHALKEFDIDRSKSRLRTEQPRAGVEVQYLSPTPLTFRQWDGFTPPPSREFPNQWHVEASTTEMRPQLSMLTLIVPYRAGQRPAWSAQRIESESAIGVRLIDGGKPTTVTLPKPATTGPVRIDRQ